MNLNLSEVEVNEISTINWKSLCDKLPWRHLAGFNSLKLNEPEKVCRVKAMVSGMSKYIKIISNIHHYWVAEVFVFISPARTSFRMQLWRYKKYCVSHLHEVSV